MIVAVISVWMMQATIDQIIDVIAMRDGFMATSRTVDMTRLLATASIIGGASIGVLLTDFDHVFDHRAVFANMVQVSIVEVIDVVPVLNPCVFAIGSMLVVVIFVNVTHDFPRDSRTTLPSRA